MKRYWEMDKASQDATLREVMNAARKSGIRDSVMTTDCGVIITFQNGTMIWNNGRTISFRHGTEDVRVTL